MAYVPYIAYTIRRPFMRTEIHERMQANISTCTLTYLHVHYMHICMHTFCIRVLVHTCRDVCRHTRLHVYKHIHTDDIYAYGFIYVCVHKTGRECTPYALGRVYLYWMHNLWLYSRLYMVLFHLLNACLPYFVLRSCGRERREKATTPPRAAKFRPEQDDTNYAEVDYVCAESAITIIIWIPSPNPFYL